MARVDDGRAKEAQQWLETVLGVSLPDFFENIRDGVYLCDAVNKIKPGTCKLCIYVSIPVSLYLYMYIRI